jgi:hypothetical protein
MHQTVQDEDPEAEGEPVPGVHPERRGNEVQDHHRAHDHQGSGLGVRQHQSAFRGHGRNTEQERGPQGQQNGNARVSHAASIASS